jgi:hypothetical protein
MRLSFLALILYITRGFAQTQHSTSATASDFEPLKVIFEGATAIGTLVAAGSLFFLKRSLDEQKRALDLQTKALDAQTQTLEEQRVALDLDYKWRRTTAAIDLMRDWNEKVTWHRDLVVELGRKLYGPSNGTDFIRPIEGDEPDLLWNAVADDPDPKQQMRAKINTSLLSLLNYFEYLSSAILNGSVEQAIIKTSFQDPMKRWHKSLHDYIDYVDDKTGRLDKNPVTWRPYCDLMRQWDEDSVRPISPPTLPTDVRPRKAT